jgi:predicted transcriptional regulator
MPKPDSAPLTDAQREIMEVFWQRGEATVSEVRDALARRDLARNTVQTMIVRLEERGWLKHREAGRTFVYAANVPRTVSLGAKVSQMVDRLFSGAPEELVTALIEYRGLTADEAARIRKMIDEAEQRNKSNDKTKRGKTS